MQLREFKLTYIAIVFSLLIQWVFIFNINENEKEHDSSNSVIDYRMVNVFMPMVKEAYADFSYVSTSISLVGVSYGKIKKSMLANDYKRNIRNIIKLNPELKDTYYMTEGHFHGINLDLNDFATSILKEGFINLKGYSNLWELYFMAGMNTYLYSDNSEGASYFFEKAYQLTKSDRFLRLAEISKHKNGKLFVGLMTYSKLIESGTDASVLKTYKAKKSIYQRGWEMQKNILIFKRDKGRIPSDIIELSNFVNINLEVLRKDLKESNLSVSYDNKSGIVDVVLIDFRSS